MKKKLSDGAVLVWACVLVLGALGYLASGFVPWRKIVDHQGLAAWVQAIGSIAAIGVAFLIPWHQRRVEQAAVEVRRRTAAEDAAVLVSEPLQHAYVTVANMSHDISSDLSLDPRKVKVLLADLATLEMPEPALLMSLLPIDASIVFTWTRANKVVVLARRSLELVAERDPFQPTTGQATELVEVARLLKGAATYFLTVQSKLDPLLKQGLSRTA